MIIRLNYSPYRTDVTASFVNTFFAVKTNQLRKLYSTSCIRNNDFKDKVACAEIADVIADVKFYTEKVVENYKKGNYHRSNSNTLLVDKEFSPTIDGISCPVFLNFSE